MSRLPTTRGSILALGAVLVAVGIFAIFFGGQLICMSDVARLRWSRSALLFTYAGALFMAYDIFYSGKHAVARVSAEVRLSAVCTDKERQERIRTHYAQAIADGKGHELVDLLNEEDRNLVRREKKAKSDRSEALSEMPKKVLGWMGVCLIAARTLIQLLVGK